MALVLNGRCLQRPVTGVERYALQLQQVLARMDMPFRTEHPRGTGPAAGHLWEQFALPLRLQRGEILISPANTGPLLARDQVLVVHDLAWLHHPEWFSWGFATWYRSLLPALMKRVRGVMTVSPHVAADISAQWPRLAGRIHVVPPAAMRPPRSATPLRDREPFLLFIGPGDPRKDVRTFQRAFALHRSVNPSVRAVVVGDGGHVFAATGAQPAEGEHWMGRVDDTILSDLMLRATALVMPSRLEGFGLPVLEAMAHGCPAIVSDLPVFRENFGEAVLRVPAGDAATLAAAMNRLVTEPGLGEHHARAGLERAAQFTRAAQLKALQDAIHHLTHDLIH